ncbi:MAG: hypothetical protein EA373_03030 [Oceanospirillales bacterium]|nr:MAG: hypothetical protein EA373_03030 [Oceanospirillales bacterium]
MGDMIRDMALAIADAQMELDANSVDVAHMMSGKQPLYDENGQKIPNSNSLVSFAGEDVSMLELGFTPTFYQFVDTIIEVKIAIKISQSESERNSVSTTEEERESTLSGRLSLRRGKASGTRKRTINTTQVDATYSSRYSYSAEGASILRTKLCPVPPPPVLEERIRALIENDES